jgi:hypothetical protein
MIRDCSRQYATNVGVQHGNRFTEGERRNGIRRVAANTWQGTQLNRPNWNLASEVLDHHRGGGVEKLCPSAKSQPVPLP